MNLFKKLSLLFSVFILLFFFVSPVFAAAPDGSGPWADTVVSSNQGLMKNGLAVPAARSDPTAALGVAENTPTIDSTFFSLGFGGNIVLGLDNGISSGVFVVEATIEPGYPVETAKVEMSEDGVNWVMAGNVSQDGVVSKPEQITCAKFVRITDTSVAANYPDAIADGYDVDGARANGDDCTPTPTPTATPTLAASPTPGQNPTATPGPTSTPGPGPGPTSPPGPGPTSTPGPGPTSTPGPTATPTPVRFGFVGSSPCIRSSNPLVPCFPNTGFIPGFPNTGFNPHSLFSTIQNTLESFFSFILKAVHL